MKLRKGILMYMSNPNGWRNKSVMGGAEIVVSDMIARIDKFDRYLIGTKQVISLLGDNITKSHIYSFPINNLFAQSNILFDIIFGIIYLIRSVTIGLKIKNQIDLVYASTTNFSDILPAKIISIILRKPLITKYHISIYESSKLFSIYKILRSEKNGIIDSIIRSILAKLTISILQSSSLNICTCQYIANQLRNANVASSKIAVNYLGFDLCQIDNVISSIGEQKKVYDFCYLGRIEANKGVQDIVALVKYYHDKGISKKTVIIGDGTFLDEIKKRVAILGLSNNFNFVGFIQGNLKYQFLLQSKVFIAPSYAKEGFGMTIFEAAYVGCEVVAYNNEIFNEIYKNISNVHLLNVGISNLYEFFEKKGLGKKYNINEFQKKFNIHDSVYREIILINKILDE